MCKWKAVFAAVILTTIASTAATSTISVARAYAGQATSEESPSLAVTTAFLKELIEDQRRFEFSVSRYDSIGRPSSEFRRSIRYSVEVSEDNCHIKAISSTQLNNGFPTDSVVTIDLSRVTGIHISDASIYDSAHGNSGGKTTFSPSPTVLEIAEGGDRVVIFVADKTLAPRLAKAISHAAILCGGGKAQPF